MRLLALLAVFLLPVSAFAQSVPPLSLEGSATVLHPAPGMSYLYDQRGNSVSLYEALPGASMFLTQDRYGNISSQGYLFEPLPPIRPLQVPISPWRGSERVLDETTDLLLDRIR